MSLSAELAELRGELKRVSRKPGEMVSSGFMDNFVQMPESDGLVVVRILPSRTNRVRDLFCSTRLHTINGKRVHCRREIVGEHWKGNCPVCDYYNYLWAESDKKPKDSDEQNALRTEARGLKPNERYYYNVIVKDQKGSFRNNQPNRIGVPLILSVGKQVHARILRAILGSEEDMEEPLGEIYDMESGRDFKILKKNKKDADGRVFPFYEESKFLDPSPAGSPDQIAQWLETMHDLQALRVLLTPEDMKRQIRIHKGLEKDPNQGFDPREFEAQPEPNVQIESHPKVAPAVETKAPAAPAKAPASPAISDEDAALLEDEFLKSLEEPK